MRLLNSDFLFEKNPRRVETVGYRACVDRCVERFSKYEGLQAVYQFGSVSSPGISDIDLLLIFDDEAPLSTPQWQTACTLDDRYLLMHAPAVLPASLVGESAYLAFLNAPQLLWGKSLFPPGGAATSAFVKHLIASEQLMRLLINLDRQLHVRRIKVRPTLCELYSLKYDFVLVPDFKHALQGDFVTGIGALRNSWFELGETKRFTRLLELLKQAIELVNSMLLYLAEWARVCSTSGRANETQAVASRWRGIKIVSTTAERGVRVEHPSSWPKRWLTGPLRRIPVGRARDLVWRLSPPMLCASSGLFYLLRGCPAGLTKELADILRARAQAIGRYVAFLESIDPRWGSIWSGVFDSKTYARAGCS